MRFLLTLILFSIAYFAIGQNNFATNGGAKISSTEKKRFENEFKALGSFYIDDSGLVVYQGQSDTNQEQKSNNNLTDDPQEKKENVSVDEDVPIVDKRKKQNTEVIETKTTVSPNSAFFKKEIIVLESDKKISDNKSTINQDNNDSNVLPKASVKTDSPKSEKVEAKNLKKGSILNQRKESQYKTMEEAALAVEALLEELRKEEGETTGSGSMSTKLSRGVNKNLRKKTPVDNSFNIQNNKNNNQTRVEVDKFGIEPSYFINGEEVDKTEVAKLPKKDIIRREIRVRNTVTGNPNGEVWYETK